MSNALRGIGITNDLNKRKVKIFDVDKKELICVCESVSEASRMTGIPNRTITTHISRKTRSEDNLLNKTLAFR